MPKSATKSTKKAQSARGDGHQVRETSAEGVEATQAREAGAKFDWHYGRVSRLGNFEVAGGREVVIVWDEGGVSSQQGNISDEEWDILKLAFMSTGRVAILSDESGDNWRSDFRFLEAVR
ncbi:MAG: hypothetical protein M3430_20455 [Acidobacteriota bacterium]|nr:hypothetical protein [Acidobacteriota bacterium]